MFLDTLIQKFIYFLKQTFYNYQSRLTFCLSTSLPTFFSLSVVFWFGLAFFPFTAAMLLYHLLQCPIFPNAAVFYRQKQCHYSWYTRLYLCVCLLAFSTSPYSHGGRLGKRKAIQNILNISSLHMMVYSHLAYLFLIDKIDPKGTMMVALVMSHGMCIAPLNGYEHTAV